MPIGSQDCERDTVRMQRREDRHDRHKYTDGDTMPVPLAQGCIAYRLRRHLADRRNPQVVARVQRHIHVDHHGHSRRPTAGAQMVVRLLGQPPAPRNYLLLGPRRHYRDADRTRADLRLRAQADLHRRRRVQPDHLGHCRGLRGALHLRRLRHRDGGHLCRRVLGPLGPQLLRRAVAAERRLLPRAPHLVVVEGRRDAQARARAARLAGARGFGADPGHVSRARERRGGRR